jgi:hypothetical protein
MNNDPVGISLLSSEIAPSILDSNSSIGVIPVVFKKIKNTYDFVKKVLDQY